MSKFRRITKRFWGFAGVLQIQITKYFTFSPFFPLVCLQLPIYFTKLLKPLEKHWRIQGSCIDVFLDDGWAIVEDNEGCLVKALSVRQDLYNAGFVINEEKSVWEPSHVLDWLGITWNSLLGTLKTVDRRVTKITSTILSYYRSRF